MTENTSLSAAAISALQRGNKIEAIKHVREERNIGLKEAKDLVEDYLKTQPSLQRKLDSTQAETKRGCLLVLGVILALIVFGYYFIVGK
ncbi:MAG: ribosomal protein L7/L12 [Gammaproteobacteria bacterium]|nr:ribosomal protein L7/L12 [Gammaproteobacteria bacterium]